MLNRKSECFRFKIEKKLTIFLCQYFQTLDKLSRLKNWKTQLKETKQSSLMPFETNILISERIKALSQFEL